MHLREHKKNETNQQALPKAVLGIIRMKMHLMDMQRLRKVVNA